MKTFLIIIGALLFLFVGAQIYFYKSSNNIEGYQYDVLTSFEGFEVRKYEASLFTTVKLDTDKYKQASGKGFSILGGYIFGKNGRQERMSMTSPVAMTLENKMTMSFLVPQGLTKKNLPKPDNINIKFLEVPEKKMAAITFSGWASDAKIKKYKEQLIQLLDKNNIKYTSNFSVLGYNPPYELFFRRNEIVVELD